MILLSVLGGNLVVHCQQVIPSLPQPTTKVQSQTVTQEPCFPDSLLLIPNPKASWGLRTEDMWEASVSRFCMACPLVTWGTCLFTHVQDPGKIPTSKAHYWQPWIPHVVTLQ